MVYFMPLIAINLTRKFTRKSQIYRRFSKYAILHEIVYKYYTNVSKANTFIKMSGDFQKMLSFVRDVW